MQRRKVVVAIPAYSGEVHTATMLALFADAQTLRAQGVEVEIITRDGIAIIALARALLVAEFLAGDGTDFVFADADIGWEPGALVKLLSHPVDFVAGVVPTRRDPHRVQGQYSRPPHGEWTARSRYRRNGLHACDTGCA
jgi:hypothetical protein